MQPLFGDGEADGRRDVLEGRLISLGLRSHARAGRHLGLRLLEPPRAGRAARTGDTSGGRLRDPLLRHRAGGAVRARRGSPCSGPLPWVRPAAGGAGAPTPPLRRADRRRAVGTGGHRRTGRCVVLVRLGRPALARTARL